MKKLFSVLICFVLLFSVIPLGTFWVSAVSDGDYTYMVNTYNEATITGYNGDGGDVVIPSTLGGYTVKRIDGYAFSGCSGLTSVTIPDSLTSIGSDAFYECTGLTSITIPDSVTSIGSSAFFGCSGLTGVTIPSGLTSIPRSSFCRCTGLTSITIPDGVTSIGEMAFSHCSGLTGVTIPDSVIRIDSEAFRACTDLTNITIPSKVTDIGSYAFQDCTGLTGMTIPDSVTEIGYAAFLGCSSFTGINVGDGNIKYSSVDGILYNKNKTELICCPGEKAGAFSVSYGVTTICDSAFSGCKGLTSVTIPDSVTSIGGYAFDGCTGLTSVTIPDSVTSIGNCAFSGCSSLTGINVGDGNMNYSSVDGFLLSKDKAELVSCPCGKTGAVILPDCITRLGYYAFYGCTELTSVTVPDSVTYIDGTVFYECDNLTGINVGEGHANYSSVDGFLLSKDKTELIYCPYGKSGVVVLPDCVKRIVENAFYGCAGLTDVIIPDGVTSIDWFAFVDCGSLTGLTVPNSVTAIDSYAFWHCNNFVIRCYNGSYAMTFAQQNSIPYRLLYDYAASGDGVASPVDYMNVTMIVLDMMSVDNDTYTCYDVDRDGKVTSADALAVKYALIGINL